MAVAGKDGSVKFDNSGVAEMRSWSLNPTADEIDTSNFDSGQWKEYMGGLKEWTCATEGNLVKGHVAGVVNKLGEIATVELKVSATDGALTFSGQAFITSVDIDVPVDDKASISMDFRGTGELTAV